MKKTNNIIVVLLIATFFLAGCQESESQMVKRARLIGNENLQLKKQLADKDKEIQSLKDEIARMEKEREKENTEFGEVTIKTLQMISECQKQVEALQTENKTLKEQLKQ